MVVYDESGHKVEDVDYSKGYVEVKAKAVTHTYKVDVERKTHFEVIAEYPETGGQDVEEVVDVEEQGHWETTDDETGEVVADFDGVIPEDWPHEIEVSGVWQYGVYHEYTAEELSQIEQERKEAQEKAEEAAKMPERVTSVEEQLTNLQLAMADIYEGSL